MSLAASLTRLMSPTNQTVRGRRRIAWSIEVAPVSARETIERTGRPSQRAARPRDRSKRSALERRESRVVVRLLGDLGNQLGVLHFVVGADDEHRAGHHALQRAAAELDPVALAEAAVADVGGGGHRLDALGLAKALLRERQVGADDQHGDVAERSRLLVELARLGLTDRRVQARNRDDDFLLAGEVLERHRREIALDEREVGSLVPD